MNVGDRVVVLNRQWSGETGRIKARHPNYGHIFGVIHDNTRYGYSDPRDSEPGFWWYEKSDLRVIERGSEDLFEVDQDWEGG